MSGGTGAADSGLRQLVARLDGELAQERRARQLLEARISSLEEAVKRDRVDREAIERWPFLEDIIYNTYII